jgi:hypothetical protein
VGQVGVQAERGDTAPPLAGHDASGIRTATREEEMPPVTGPFALGTPLSDDART